MSSGRTLWEEGRRPGRQVVTLAVATSLAVVALDVLLSEELTYFYDLTFVVICLGAALSVRPRDFFGIGVLPPLLMFATVVLLGLVSRGAVADERDGMIQAIVSGLAHHSGALVAGYAITLGVLALRQTALRNSGRIRGDRPRDHVMS